MISRRSFLQQTTLSSLGVIAGSSFIDPAGATSKLKEIGLIVNVINAELKKDWQGTLRTVAQIGTTIWNLVGTTATTGSSLKSL
jgi:hypothetical protein